MTHLRSVCLAAATLVGAGANPLPVAASEPLVQCAVFAPNIKCANPIVQGIIDGQWVGLVLHFDGTNGGPDSMDVVIVGFQGNGLLTGSLPKIKPEGEYGDRMSADFRNGKLFVSNAIYLPGEGHCCYSHLVVRRFGFHGGKLLVEGEVTVPTNASSAAEVDAALSKIP